MIVNDILQVIYAPQKALKRIIENPKYLGAFIILILFIGIQVAYDYSQFSKTYLEQTSPLIGQLDTFTNASSGNWQSSSGVTLTNNINDYLNYTVYWAGYGYIPNIYGNSSLQISAQNANNISVTLANAFNVDCSQSGFQNLSMIIKPVAPQTAPQKVTLTLYSLGDTGYYQYDLTSSLSSTSTIGQWNNLTIPIGPNAVGWTPSGAPTWNNMTKLQLGFTYPSGSNATVEISALFFRGQYLAPTDYNNTGVLLEFLQAFSLQFLVSWFLIAGVIYLMFKALKSSVLWKPIFIAVGFALFVMAIRAIVSLIATLALPAVYYPFDLSVGISFTPYGVIVYPSQVSGMLSAESLSAFNNIQAATAAFNDIILAMFVVAYVWLGALCTVTIGTLKPEFSMFKRIALSAVAIAITILILIFLVNGIA